MNFLEQHKSDIEALCRQYKVKSLYAFGSVLTNRFGPDSDVDLLVDLGEQSAEDYSESYFRLAEALETLLRRPVDLLTIRSLINPFFIRQVNDSKTMLFAA